MEAPLGLDAEDGSMYNVLVSLGDGMELGSGQNTPITVCAEMIEECTPSEY